MHFIKHKSNKYYKIISSSSFYMLPLPLLLRSFTFIMCIVCVEQCCSAMGSAPFPALYSVSQSRLESPSIFLMEMSKITKQGPPTCQVTSTLLTYSEIMPSLSRLSTLNFTFSN